MLNNVLKIFFKKKKSAKPTQSGTKTNGNRKEFVGCLAKTSKAVFRSF